MTPEPRATSTAILTPTATGAATETPQQVVATNADGGAPPIQAVSGTSGGGIADLLPGPEDVPSGLMLTDDRQRALAEVVGNYDDPAETTALFRDWGWQGNAIRTYSAPEDGSSPPGGIVTVYASVHRFDGAAATAEALDYSLLAQAATTDVTEVVADAVGDYSRALYGPSPTGDEVTLLVQSGDALIRVSVVSPIIDPTQTAIDIVRSVLAR